MPADGYSRKQFFKSFSVEIAPSEWLYNQANKGSVFLRTVVLKKAGGERDVSDQLSGKLPTPGSHPILVKYADSTRAFAAYWRLRVDLKLVDTQERPDTVSCEARVRHRARVSHSKP